MARNSQIGPYVYPAVPAEFSNWRDEQVAWRETSALFDQSHHMTDLQIEGPDMIELLSHLGVNTFENFAVNKAKQLVVCNHDGYVIGDAILFHLDENRVRLVGRPSAHNWVQYHAETGGYDVQVSRDERTAVNPTGGRELYRFQVQGPTAMQVLEKANGGPLPEIKFFNMGELTIGGRKVRALHHGMSGVPGLELFGPWEEREDVSGAIVEAGEDFGLRQVGSRVVRDEHARVGLDPVPASGGLHRRRAEGLPRVAARRRYEGTGSLGGSFVSDDIADYYLTPHDLGYWPFVKFDHDFVGREALVEMADRPARKKVTLAWNGEDVAQAIGSLFEKGDPAKYIDIPLSNYATWPYDKVLDGRRAGRRLDVLRVQLQRALVPLARDGRRRRRDRHRGHARLGRGGRRIPKPVVERHRQAEIRAIVSPCPYSEVARSSYHEGWRTKAAVT